MLSVSICDVYVTVRSYRGFGWDKQSSLVVDGREIGCSDPEHLIAGECRLGDEMVAGSREVEELTIRFPCEMQAVGVFGIGLAPGVYKVSIGIEDKTEGLLVWWM